jgi:hypothetical protein
MYFMRFGSVDVITKLPSVYSVMAYVDLEVDFRSSVADNSCAVMKAVVDY